MIHNLIYLETCTLVSQLSDTVKYKIDNFLSDGVVTTGVVVGSVLFATDQLFRVEQLSVRSGTDFINNSWFQINKDTTWDVFTRAGFGEEGVE